MKRKYVKSILAAALAGVMTIGLAACGSDSTDNGSSTGSSTSTSESSTASGTDELYWFSDVSGWGPSTANWKTTESPAIQYIEENFGLTLDVEQPPTDASTKLGLMIASGDLPDLMSITDSDMYKQLVSAGKVWDMKSFLEKYDPDSHLLKDFPEDVKQALVDTYGDWYSYPSHMESADNRETFVPDDQVWVDVVEKGDNSCIMFNKEIMDAVGITEDDVKTEEGFYAACEKVKTSGYTVDGQSVLPVVLHADQWINNSLDAVISNNFGVVPVDEDGNYVHKETTPGYKNALKFVNNLIQKGYLDVNTMTIDETALKTYLDAKRVFCWIGNQAQQDKTNMPWVSYGPVAASNGAKPVLGKDLSAGTGWIQTLVSKDCKNPEKVAKMISWLSSKEGLMSNYYGVEGTDYTVDEKGIVTRTEEGTKTYAEDYNNNIMMWPFANTSFERSTEPVPEANTNRGEEVQLMTAFGKDENTYIYDSSLLAFQNSQVLEPSSDLGLKLGQVKTYLESEKTKIVTAGSDDEFEKEYQSMLDTLDSYSIKEIDAEYDKVYKEYCEKKGTSIEDVNADLYK